MHHEQDIPHGRSVEIHAGDLVHLAAGSLALIGTRSLPASTQGFDHRSRGRLHIPGSSFAYFAVVAGVFITAFYSFRMYFLVFHGEERFRHYHHDDHHGHHDDHGHGHAHVPHESPWVVTCRWCCWPSRR